MSKIPTQIYDFTAYNDNDKLIGTGSEVTLPTVSFITKEHEFPSGKADIPGLRTENMEVEIPFNIFDEEAAGMISLTSPTALILRGSAQKVNTSTHTFSPAGIKVTVKGFAKEVELGTLKRSDGMDSKVKLTITYMKVEDGDGNTFIEIDKLNDTLIVNDEDVRSGIDKYL